MASTSGLIVSWHVVMMPLPMTLDCGEMEGGKRAGGQSMVVAQIVPVCSRRFRSVHFRICSSFVNM